MTMEVTRKVNEYYRKTSVSLKGVQWFKQRLTHLKQNRWVRKSYQLVFSLYGLLPADKKLIIFESYNGKQYSCNPRAIYEYMLEHYPEYKMIWSVDRRYTKLFEDKNIPYLKRFSIKWMMAMARAKYWVINSRLPLWVPKPRHTIYIQTWHGTPLKKLAMDMDEVYMPGTTTEKYKKNFAAETKRWDYLISPNAYSTDIFRRAFQFHKNMVESGYPRNDYLYTKNNDVDIRKIKLANGLPLDKKIILYAPTWRDNEFYDVGKYKFNLVLNLQLMQEMLGDEYIILLRLHYLVAENLDLSSYKGFAFDFSAYEDIRDLYLVSDLLMTDYSSVFFDYANLKRPMIFFVYDIESYRDKLRGFYFDFEEKAPGPLVKTTEEVIDAIKKLEASNFQVSDEMEKFYNKFCYLECGESSKRVVEQIFR